MDLRGPATDTRAGDTVSLFVPPDGPYGVTFVPDVEGCAAVVQSFEQLPNGKFGPIQRHGGIHIGDVLFEINDMNLMNRQFLDAMKIVTDRNILKKEFKFVNSREYYRRKRTGSLRVALPIDRNPFFSSFRRSRTSEDGNSKRFTEYEIACQFRLASNKVQKEIVFQWSVWKRYSDLEKLHQRLKVSLGWQMDGIDFPPSRSFSLNKLSPEFIEQRKSELNDYWQKVVSKDKVTEFNKHHCNLDLKEFLEVEANTKREVAPAPDMVMDAANSNVPSNFVADTEKKSSRRIARTSSRRLSLTKANSMNVAESVSPPAPPSAAEENPRNVPPSPPPSAASTTSHSPPPSTAAPNPVPSAQPTMPAANNPPPASQIPPKPTGSRANLLGSINALRKD